MLLLFVAVGIAVVVSFICSMTESALLSLTPSQLADIRLKRPGIAAQCKRFKAEIGRPLAVILLLNTAANMMGAAVAGAQFTLLWGKTWVEVFSFALAVFMVQYCEILPKTIGVRFSPSVMIVATRPLQVLVFLLSPLIRFSHRINRPFEFRNQAEPPPNTTDEILALAASARSSQEISTRQERIIRAAPRLSDQTASEIMLPAANVSFLSSTQSIDEALNSTHIDFHTRYPLCDAGDHNKVVGYVNFKELVALWRSRPDTAKLSEIVRPIAFVAPDDSAANILERFAVQHVHMAIVRDEHGLCVGLITMEDIVEELIGDLDDEFDPLSRTFYSPGPGFWVVGGGMAMSALARETHLNLPRRAEPLAMWFTRQLKRNPKVGDQLRHHNVELTVRKVRRGRGLEFNVKTI